MTRSIAHTRIYLTGFMGSGKSTVGPAVAEALGWTFIDLDDAVVRAAGRPVPEIFEQEGEEGFRRREHDALMDAARREHVVVALGGGAIVDPVNRALVLETGVLVCLTARLVTLAERLTATASNRPLLKDGRGAVLEGEALVDRIRGLLLVRRAAYDAAHVAVDTDDGPAVESARRVIEAVRTVPAATGARAG